MSRVCTPIQTGIMHLLCCRLTFTSALSLQFACRVGCRDKVLTSAGAVQYLQRSIAPVAGPALIATSGRGRGQSQQAVIAMSAVVRESSVASAVSNATTVISADYGEEVHMFAESTVGPNPEALLGSGVPSAGAQEGAAVAASSGSDGPAVAALGQPAVAGDASRTPSEVCGEFGIYQANWGGRSRSADLRDHVLQDVCFTNPCQVICAQEVEPEFVKALLEGGVRDPAGRRQAGEVPWERSRMHPERCWKQGSWLVVKGEEFGKTNIIAAKPSRFKDIKLLEWHKNMDQEYTVKARPSKSRRGRGDSEPQPPRPTRQAVAFSRVLVAELFFVKPWCGRDSIKIMNVHMHHLTAKKTVKAESTSKFFRGLFAVIERHRPQLMCGDFNMSLFQILAAFRGYFEPVLLASYAWRQVDGSTIEEGGDEDSDDEPSPPPPPPPPPRSVVTGPGLVRSDIPPRPTRPVPGAPVPAVAAPPAPVPPPPPPQQQQQPAAVAAPDDVVKSVRFDSCGIFSLVPIKQLRSPFTVKVLDGGEAVDALRVFPKGQGYPVTSYMGGAKAFRETMAHQAAAVAAAPRSENPLPGCSQKHVDPAMFDKLGMLFRSGAHMPLMAFLGHGAFRTPEGKKGRHARQQKARRDRERMAAEAGQSPPPVVTGEGHMQAAGGSG